MSFFTSTFSIVDGMDPDRVSLDTVPKPCASGPELVFIVHNKPEKFSKPVATQIRKHVMKDIGRARRKEKRHCQIPLDVPTNLANHSQLPLRPNSHQSSAFQLLKLHESLPQNQGRDGTISTAPRQPTTKENIDQLAQQRKPYQKSLHDFRGIDMMVEKLGAGRGDPFARYPIKMNLHVRELIDQGTLSLHICVIADVLLAQYAIAAITTLARGGTFAFR